MHMDPCRIALLASVVLALGGAPGSWAQTPPRGGPAGAALPAPAAAAPASAPVTPRPERTTATYGDWILRCELLPGGADRACEVAQTVQDARGQPLAQLIARRPVPEGAVLLSVQVGASVTVAEPLRLSIEGQAALTLPFRRCLPRGCFAEAQPADAELGAFLSRTEPARLEFTDGDGQPVAIPASLRGLAASLDALRAAGRG